jgi:hypothetical protein
MYSNIYPTRCNITQFILLGNCSTRFGWYHHPSSGAQTTISTDLVFVTSLLLSAAIVEELELVWVCCGWRMAPTAHHSTAQHSTSQHSTAHSITNDCHESLDICIPSLVWILLNSVCMCHTVRCALLLVLFLLRTWVISCFILLKGFSVWFNKVTERNCHNVHRINNYWTDPQTSRSLSQVSNTSFVCLVCWEWLGLDRRDGSICVFVFVIYWDEALTLLHCK